MSKYQNEQLKVRLTILSAMTTRKETPQHELKRLTGLSYRTIIRYLPRLQEEKMIKLARTEPGEKGGKQRKIYELTFRGLMCSFLNEKAGSELKKIVNANSHMLLAFRKFPLFQKAGLELYFLFCVERTIESYLNRVLEYQSYDLTLDWQKEESFKEFIDSAILIAPFSVKKPNPEKWEAWRVKFMRVCKDDKELSEFVKNKLESFEKRLLGIVERSREWERL